MKFTTRLRVVIFLIAVSTAVISTAQVAPNIIWESDYNNPSSTGSDWNIDVTNVGDGTYLTAGWYGTSTTHYPCINKYDGAGTLLWQGRIPSCASTGNFTQVIVNSNGEYVAIGQMKIPQGSPCFGTAYDLCVIGVWTSSGVFVNSYSFNYPGAGYVTTQGASIMQCTPAGASSPYYVIAGRTGTGPNTSQEVAFYEVLNSSFASLGAGTYGIQNSPTYGRFSRVVFAPANGLTTIGDGFTVSGTIANATNTNNDAYVARYSLSSAGLATYRYETVINSTALPTGMSLYTKIDNNTSQCTPGSANDFDEATDISYITGPSGPTSKYIVSMLFHEYRGTCSSAAYKDADGVLLNLTETNTGFTYGYYANVAHFSGEDFQFKTKYYSDVNNFGDYVSIGTTQDTYLTPSHNPMGYIFRTHLAGYQGSFAQTRNVWKRFVRTDVTNPVCPTCSALTTSDMCGFGIDLAPNQETGVMDYIICGNNNHNGDDGITMLLTCDCDANDVITSTTASGIWPGSLNQVINGKINISSGNALSFDGVSGTPMRLRFNKPCGGVSTTGGTVTLNNAILEPTPGFQNTFNGIVTNAGNVIATNATYGSQLNSAIFGINQTTYSSTLHNNINNVTFYNCGRAIQVATPLIPNTTPILTTGDVYNNCTFTYNETGEYYPVLFQTNCVGLSFQHCWPQTVTNCVFNTTSLTGSAHAINFRPIGIGHVNSAALNVSGCIFNNVPAGISSSGGAYSNVFRNNTFNNIPAGPSSTLYNFGISLKGNYASSADGNTFIATASPSTTLPSAGIICESNPSTGNMIYNNIFGNSSYASSSSGLMLKGTNTNQVIACNSFNSFTGGTYAWNVTSGTLSDQGTVSAPAGNQWSNCSGTASQINSVSAFNYYWNGASQFNPTLTSGVVVIGIAGSTGCSGPWVVPAGTTTRVTEGSSYNVIANQKNALEALELKHKNNPSEETLSDLTSAQTLMQQMNNSIVRKFITNNNFDSINPFLSSSDLIGDKYYQLQLLYDAGHYSEAKNLITQLRNHYNFKTYYSTERIEKEAENERANFIAYFDIVIDIAISGKRASEIDDAIVSQLYDILYSKSPASVFAETMITEITGRQFPQVIAEQETSDNGFSNSLSDNLSTEHYINAYPNPATDKVFFVFKLPKMIENAEIVIYDIKGSIMSNLITKPYNNQLIMSTIDLANGIYFYSLNYANARRSSGKFIVNK